MKCSHCHGATTMACIDVWAVAKAFQFQPELLNFDSAKAIPLLHGVPCVLCRPDDHARWLKRQASVHGEPFEEAPVRHMLLIKHPDGRTVYMPAIVNSYSAPDPKLNFKR